MNNLLQTLKKGDIVDVLAPSGRGKKEDLDNIAKYIESFDLIPRIADDIYSNEDIFYSNTNEYRANAFKEALVREDSKLLWCIRGGEGATEIIPYLEGKIKGFDGLSEIVNDKILIGYSDITALHIYLQNEHEILSIHGPMLEKLIEDYYTKESEELLIDILFNEKESTNYRIEKQISNSYINENRIIGKMTGGNLTLVEKSLGTNWEIDTKDKIIFLEDIGEPAYKIERALTHLNQANIFEEAKAVILCDFVKTLDEELIPQVMERFAEKVDIPVFHMSGIGHGSENKPIIYNSTYTIDAENLYLSTGVI